MPTQDVIEPASMEGSFEYVAAKIRRDAEGTTFGRDFEWFCHWFLQNAPRYRGQFDKVWLWNDWPDRWGPDAGIDFVARTRAGELWAIQAKAVRFVVVVVSEPDASAFRLIKVPSGTRGIISNCACLGEGVDVPVLDGV